MGSIPTAAERLQRRRQEIQAVVGEVLVDQWEENLDAIERHF
jgi:cyclopropane fatty-acyl-phospholipid synthase-like methyltransferase